MDATIRKFKVSDEETLAMTVDAGNGELDLVAKVKFNAQKGTFTITVKATTKHFDPFDKATNEGILDDIRELFHQSLNQSAIPQRLTYLAANREKDSIEFPGDLPIGEVQRRPAIATGKKKRGRPAKQEETDEQDDSTREYYDPNFDPEGERMREQFAEAEGYPDQAS